MFFVIITTHIFKNILLQHVEVKQIFCEIFFIIQKKLIHLVRFFCWKIDSRQNTSQFKTNGFDVEVETDVELLFYFIIFFFTFFLFFAFFNAKLINHIILSRNVFFLKFFDGIRGFFILT